MYCSSKVMQSAIGDYNLNIFFFVALVMSRKNKSLGFLFKRLPRYTNEIIVQIFYAVTIFNATIYPIPTNKFCIYSRDKHFNHLFICTLNVFLF